MRRFGPTVFVSIALAALSWTLASAQNIGGVSMPTPEPSWHSAELSEVDGAAAAGALAGSVVGVVASNGSVIQLGVVGAGVGPVIGVDHLVMLGFFTEETLFKSPMTTLPSQVALEPPSGVQGVRTPVPASPGRTCSVSTSAQSRIRCRSA